MAGACQLPMDSKNKTQGSQSRNDAKLMLVQQQPELLMAAREGNPTRLTHLLGTGGTLVSGGPGVVVNIGDADAAMGMSARPADTVGMDVAMDQELNSILHVVAFSGDSPDFLESARVVYGKARHLLDACNANGDTPFHCAARAGMVEMLSRLINLARAEGGGESGDRVKEVLRKQNKQGETALHEALRLAKKEVDAMVSTLMAADAQLARVAHADGASPLYLAILLGHDDIAERLHQEDEGLSYSGPNGQNALHAAVLRSTWMTNNLLEWNKDLSKQGDKPKGSTPLHFAASCGFQEMSLVKADKSLVYQSDMDGSFPIHVAVIGRHRDVVWELLRMCPDCGLLRDAEGKTFLHIAAQQGYWQLFTPFSTRILAAVLRGNPRFASIVNMQDNDGNTGLHHAVLVGKLQPFYFMVSYKGVMLNLSNCEGKTALDLSESKLPRGVYFGLDPRRNIHSLLRLAGARYGAHSGNRKPELEEKKESKKIMESTQTIGVVSALVVTITFAAAFTVPGGYRADDDPRLSSHTAGTPVLAASYSFQAFIVANSLAMFCSTMSTISLMYAGITTVDIGRRMNAFDLSIFFLNGSARSLAAAFAFGMYAALAPVAHAAAVFTWVCMAATLLDVAWYVGGMPHLVLFLRLGVGVWMLAFAVDVTRTLIRDLWPYAVIAGFLAYSKIHGIH